MHTNKDTKIDKERNRYVIEVLLKSKHQESINDIHLHLWIDLGF